MKPAPAHIEIKEVPNPTNGVLRLVAKTPLRALLHHTCDPMNPDANTYLATLPGLGIMEHDTDLEHLRRRLNDALSNLWVDVLTGIETPFTVRMRDSFTAVAEDESASGS